jgi:hypothetical protein
LGKWCDDEAELLDAIDTKYGDHKKTKWYDQQHEYFDFYKFMDETGFNILTSYEDGQFAFGLDPWNGMGEKETKAQFLERAKKELEAFGIDELDYISTSYYC